ncbi:MAG TPA: XRE family transcriptional regulator [Thermoanaerobaculaceae bacterium]|nr:XRE family transcriptional regulator [Thermoanaerobaculaceae bacterium]
MAITRVALKSSNDRHILMASGKSGLGKEEAMADSLAIMIQEARKKLKMTQAQVAAAIERSKTTVVDIERGRTVPDDARILLRLAQALRLDAAELFARALRDRTSGNEHIPEDVWRYLGESLLLRVLPEAAEIDVCSPRSYKVIEAIAEALADDLFPMQVEDGAAIPVFDALVHAEAVAEKANLEHSLRATASRELPEEARTSFEDGTFVVQLRADAWERGEAGEGRFRFTAAHEIGHVVLHQHELLKTGGVVFRDTVCSASERLRPGVPIYQSPEWQANVFAACFLMPTKAVRRYLRRAQDRASAEGLAETFGVSLQAARIRLDKLISKLLPEENPA